MIEHHPGMETPSNQPDSMHTPIEKERNLLAIAEFKPTSHAAPTVQVVRVSVSASCH